MLTDLADLLKPTTAQNIETAPRLERMQSTARAHLARGCWNLQLVREGLIEVNRGRSLKRGGDPIAEFADRKKPGELWRPPAQQCVYDQSAPKAATTATAPSELRNVERTKARRMETGAARRMDTSTKGRRKGMRKRRNRAHP